jgi:hypothetical protein
MSAESENVYAPPSATIGEVAAPSSEFERIRSECIGRESSIKGIGSLSLLGAGLWLVGLAGMVFSGVSQRDGVGFVILMAMLAVSAAIGFGLRRLLPWARMMFTILIGLFLVFQGIALVAALAGNTRSSDLGSGAVGTIIVWLIQGAFLYTLWSRPSDVIFSLRYRAEIIPATPLIRYRSPRWMYILLGVIVLLVVIGLVAAALRR